jgi:tRNA U38,U39,U40 pseudouridine synthase TruA
MPPAEVAAVFAEASKWYAAQKQSTAGADSTTTTASTTDATADTDATAADSADTDAAAAAAADITDIELLLDDETATPEEIAAAQEAVRRRKAYVSCPAVIKRAADKLKAYRISAETLSKLRDTLGLFAGVHNYHNYTIRCVLPRIVCARCVSVHAVYQYASI